MSDSDVKAVDSVFVPTKRFKAAIALFNKLDVKKFPMLLNLIVGKLRDKTKLSETEDSKAQEAFKLSQTELQTVVDAASYVFEQAAYHSLTAVLLKSQLEAVGLETAQALGFGKCWHENSESFTSRLKEQTMGSPQVLDSSSWRLQLNMGQDSLSKQKGLNVLLNFALKSTDASGKDDQEDLTVEFSGGELGAFYEKMEQIQKQLDALTAGGGAQ